MPTPRLPLIPAALGWPALPAPAALVATITESGPDLLVTVTGSLDLTGTSFTGTALYDVGNLVDANTSGVNVVDVGDMDLYSYSPTGTVSGDLLFGGTTDGNSEDNRFFMGTSVVYVTAGYVSGSPVSYTATITDLSFADLGITPGQFRTVTRATGVNSTDSFAMITAVPEPATLPLSALALGLSLRITRRRGI